jgi:hypothetical protein
MYLFPHCPFFLVLGQKKSPDAFGTFLYMVKSNILEQFHASLKKEVEIKPVPEILLGHL